MDKKFTEEQYQKIVYIWTNEYSYTAGMTEVLDYIEEEKLANKVYESAAIANPLTREWAHDKFVEKEKKYYWKLNSLFLAKAGDDGSLYFAPENGADLLSESEIREWGFNPEMFDKKLS